VYIKSKNSVYSFYFNRLTEKDGARGRHQTIDQISISLSKHPPLPSCKAPAIAQICLTLTGDTQPERVDNLVDGKCGQRIGYRQRVSRRQRLASTVTAAGFGW
jgi:hypothetical protein